MNSAAVLLPPTRRRSAFDAHIVLSYLAGTVSGAFLSALSLWVLSGFLQPLPAVVRVTLLCLSAAFVWLVKDGPLGARWHLPETRRQIPADVFVGGLARGAYLFGFEMGTGVRTYSPSVAPYLLALGLLLAHPTLGVALLAGIGFGVGRALPMVEHFRRPGDAGLRALFLRGRGRFGSTVAGLIVLAGAFSLI